MKLKEYLRDVEIMMIREAMTAANGWKMDAAKLLGINRTTLVGKLKRFNMTEEWPDLLAPKVKPAPESAYENR